jgi:anti-anti-sigma factor
VGLQISIRKCDDVTILDLRGRSTIDGGESELLSSHLQELVTNGVRKVLLNLANLTQVDSSAVGVIIETYVSLKRQVGDLKLLCPRARVLEVLNVFHLPDTIPSFEDETGLWLASGRKATPQRLDEAGPHRPACGLQLIGSAWECASICATARKFSGPETS